MCSLHNISNQMQTTIIACMYLNAIKYLCKNAVAIGRNVVPQKMSHNSPGKKSSHPLKTQKIFSRFELTSVTDWQNKKKLNFFLKN